MMALTRATCTSPTKTLAEESHSERFLKKGTDPLPLQNVRVALGQVIIIHQMIVGSLSKIRPKTLPSISVSVSQDTL